MTDSAVPVSVVTATPDFSLDFVRAYGEPACSAVVRAEPEDFQVDEIMAINFDGCGEHLCVLIRKRNQNTRWVAAQLALQTGLPESAVGFCGLKDRRAITTQWFSLHRPNGSGQLGDDDLLRGVNIESCELISWCRHGKKLRRGMHQGNRFCIRLRQVSGDRAKISRRLEQIAEQVPNYFGEQRFGIKGQNLVHADQLLRSISKGQRLRDKRRPEDGRNGIYLSSARSYLFNQILAARIVQKCWVTGLPTESSGSDAMPVASDPDGALWGRGRPAVPPEVAHFENQTLSSWVDWRHSLEHCGLSQERRALVLKPEAFDARWERSDLILNFELPVGAYATALLRELVFAADDSLKKAV